MTGDLCQARGGQRALRRRHGQPGDQGSVLPLADIGVFSRAIQS